MRSVGSARQRAIRNAGLGAVLAAVVAWSPGLLAQGPVGMESDQVSIGFLQGVTPTFSTSSIAAGGGILGRQSSGGVLGVDSLPNFSSYFYQPGQESNGFDQYTWPYTMIGNSPFAKRGDDDDRRGREGRDRDDDRDSNTTWIGAPIIPVNLDLRNADGTPRFVNGVRLFYDATQYVNVVLKSPVFSSAQFDTSRRPTQYGDALHRAQFFQGAGEGWHTMLKPSVKPARTMVLKQGTYSFALNRDGSCCAFVLINADAFVNALFPATSNNTDTASIMGSAERSGDIKTTDLATFLLPNAYLFQGTTTNCCILGFHSYDLQAGDQSNGFRERRFVMNYSSWITPGLFSGFSDITALSHEIAEAFVDPFVNNITPWWLDPTGVICQNDLENGDALEALDDPTYPMTLNGFTYHPQSVALLQWFAGQSPSSAYHGAYSFPGLDLLTTPSVSMTAGCKAPVK